MLLNVHVKNLALIDEIEMEFTDHLNILTGETGAGKSVLMGAVNMALGGRVSKDMIRKGESYALAELFFSIPDPYICERLKEMDIPMEDDQIIISRRITSGRSVCRINGEIVSVSDLKKVGQWLIDIHGQHDHQSLLDKSRHSVILDRFIREQLGDKKEKLSEAYQEYIRLYDLQNQQMMDNDQRLRQISFLEYEIEEIENAHLKIGEDEQLEKNYQRMLHNRQIMEQMSFVYQQTCQDEYASVSDRLGQSLKHLSQVAAFDPKISELQEQLESIDHLVYDFNRALSDYIQDQSFDAEDYRWTEERLNLLNRLKAKYGDSIEGILEYKNHKQMELEKYKNFDAWIESLNRQLDESRARYLTIADDVSRIRKKYAAVLEKQIEEVLKDLNFLQVKFLISIKKMDKFTKNGIDEVEFFISTNPGEDVKPLGQVASGGELSRIMLGIKSVLAEVDEIPTLIFDEIDTGISGRTAQKVAEKLSYIGRSHQVLCITHLPQIAAMADSHYMIEKNAVDAHTKTEIRKLSEVEQLHEIGRLMGGAMITQTILESADEMKKMAEEFRKTCFKN